jgi:hypothetical protein
MKGKTVELIGSHPLRWSDWEYPREMEDIPDAPGQYQARFTKGGKPAPIKRKKGMDDEGLLYWGEGGTLSDRFGDLVWSLQNPKSRPRHSGARKYIQSPILRKKYPLSRIQVRYRRDQLSAKCAPEQDIWEDNEGKMRAMVGERSGLRAYKSRFGEYPPLNSIGGRKLKGPPPDLGEPPPDPVDDLIEFGDANAELAEIRCKTKRADKG